MTVGELIEKLKSLPEDYQVVFESGDAYGYFIEPMDNSYTPKQKKFVEKSKYGALEGVIIFNKT